ncbi:MAG TPA: glycoside hydrolase family 16 protein [Saprospiraceae bacterium]|nr:glycoside hydrolase family 16 protein [Saprospiraceae bacterium]
MRTYFGWMFALFLVVLQLGCAGSKYGSGTFRKLVWSDEFNYQGLPDSTRWGYDLGDGCPKICGWGNNELEYYTVRRSENARVDKGHLIIEARKENMGNRKYTSARMVTKNKGDWRYGRMEVRAKLPKGVGIWPAIWMLPTDWAYGGWPRSGEIDIMEFVGYQPDTVYGTVHTEFFNGMKGTQKSVGTPIDDLSAAFHVYALEWHADRLDFYVDNRKFNTFRNQGQGIDAWPFDQKFHLILNIAVGGDWGGKMGVDDSIFPQQMLVDYVRVYQ